MKILNGNDLVPANEYVIAVSHDDVNYTDLILKDNVFISSEAGATNKIIFRFRDKTSRSFNIAAFNNQPTWTNNLAGLLTAVEDINGWIYPVAPPIVDAALTDAELRATPVPVSAASLPLPFGAAIAANQQTDALTDTQLRATPVPVSGTVTANAGVNLNTSALALEATLQSVKTAVEILDNTVSGSELQVDIVSAPTLTVQATNLDVRDLTFAADKVDASGTVLGAGSNNIGDVDIVSLPNEGQQTMANSISVAIASNQSAVPVTDNGGSITIDNADITAIAADTAALVIDTNLIRRAVYDETAGIATDKMMLVGGVDYSGPTGRAFEVLDLPNSNPLITTIVDGNGDQITSFGGGTQYTEGATDATIAGTAMLMEGAADTLLPVQGTVADGLLVNLGANNDVTANAGTNLNTSALALEATLQFVKTAVEVIDNAIAGSEMQVDVLTMPTVDVSGSSVDISGSTVTVDNAAGASAVNIQDGGNIITVDGTVDVTGVATEATLLSIFGDLEAVTVLLGTNTYAEGSSGGQVMAAVRRDADTTLVDTTNEFTPLQVDANGRLKVEAFSGETLPVSLASTVVVSATDLDVRNLVFATDKVDVSGSTGVGVTGPLTDAQLRATAVPVSSASVLFRGRAQTFNTPGRAGTAGQKILSIHNATGSAVVVKVRKITVDLAVTVVKAVTVPPPIIRSWKVTVLPTNGTVLAKTKIGGTTTSDAAVVVRGDASADGTGSGTTLTATLPAGTFISQEYASRLITAAGFEPMDRAEFNYDEAIELQALEGIVLFLDYTAATQNPTTDRWIVGVEWEEV